MKVLVLATLLGILAFLAACNTTASSPLATSPDPTELGNSGIHASGSLEAGGTLHTR